MPISTAAAMCIDTFHHGSVVVDHGGPLWPSYHKSSRLVSVFAQNVKAQTLRVQKELRSIFEKVVTGAVEQIDLMGLHISRAFIDACEALDNPNGLDLDNIRRGIAEITVGVVLQEALRDLPHGAVLCNGRSRRRLLPFPYHNIVLQLNTLMAGSGLGESIYDAEIDLARRIGFGFMKVLEGTEFESVLRKAERAKIRHMGTQPVDWPSYDSIDWY